jgi:hypothetical protein
MKEFLPFLLILACPLMMVFMMFGMRGHGHGAHGAQGQQGQQQQLQSGGRSVDSMTADELRELRADVEVRLQDLDDRLYDLEAAGRGGREPVGA